MAKYSVRIRESAQDEFLSIPFPFRRQINQRIFALKKDPHPESAVEISESGRLRLDHAGWRIVFGVDDDAEMITIVAFERIDPD